MMKKKKPKFVENVMPAIDEIKAERKAQIERSRVIMRGMFDQRCLNRFGITMTDRVDEICNMETDDAD